MTADSIQIICANCGAKYKLPTDFKATSAKCKGCGATIDVASQIQAAKATAAPSRPAASKPAAGKPATASKPAASSSRRARGSDSDSASERPARRGAAAGRRSAAAGRHADDEGDAEGGRRKRGAGGAKAGGAKKGNPAVLWGSVAALVAVAVVVVVFVMSGGGKDQPAGSNETAKNMAAGAGETGGAGAPGDTGTGGAETAKPEAGGASGNAAAAAGSTEPEVPKPTGEPAGGGEHAKTSKPPEKPAADATANTEPAAVTKSISPSEVFNPATLEPLAFPDYVDAAIRTEVEQLCADVRNGGRAGRNAKRRLEEIGHPALVGVINSYQKIDFTDPNQALYAFEMNKLLTDAFGAGVVSTNFKVTLAGEAIPPETADWNAKTVNAWRRFWEMYPEKEKWEAMIAKRKEGKGTGDGK